MKVEREGRYSWFPELDRATLEWEVYLVSDGNLWLKASDLARGNAKVYFLNTRYVDCPTQMQEVKLRLASESETESVRQLIPPYNAKWLKQKDLIFISCREGVFSIWATEVGVDWSGTRSEGYLEGALAAPLWRKGPSFDELL